MRGAKGIHELIRQHHTDPNFCVEKLAGLAGVSTSYLREFIRRDFRVTPHELIEDIRLEQAVQLLRSSHLPIGEVGLRTGFWSSKTFRRAFRRKFGCCPSDYRQDPAQPK